jgi:hypothetical protein
VIRAQKWFEGGIILSNHAIAVVRAVNLSTKYRPLPQHNFSRSSCLTLNTHRKYRQNHFNMTTQLEKQDIARDIAFKQALHGKTATNTNSFMAMMGKDHKAQKEAVDEYFKRSYTT